MTRSRRTTATERTDAHVPTYTYAPLAILLSARCVAAVMWASVARRTARGYSNNNAADHGLTRLRTATVSSARFYTETAHSIQRRDTLLYFYCCTTPLWHTKAGTRHHRGPINIGRGGGI